MQIFYLTLFLVGVTVPTYGYQCGRTLLLPEDNRIVGGAEAVPHSWPWQVLLQIKYQITQRGKVFDMGGACGGTIISNSWILTAAHCFVKTDDPDDIKVYSGSHYADTPAVLHNVKNVFVHEKFDNEVMHYDIALVELKNPIKYNKHTQPICLPSIDAGVDVPFNTAWTTGWGLLKTGGETSDALQQIEVPFVDMPTCRSILMERNPYFRFNKKLHICAGTEGKDSCEGDSGGPLVYKTAKGTWFQLGITSWGQEVCGSGGPALYTRVSGYCDWISSTTDGDVDCQRN